MWRSAAAPPRRSVSLRISRRAGSSPSATSSSSWPARAAAWAGAGCRSRHRQEIRAARAQAIYTEEASYQVRKSRENPAIARLYKEFLTDGPCGHTSHHLLHTHYAPPGTYLDRSGGPPHGHPLRGALRASTLLSAAEVPSEPPRSRDVKSGSLTFRAALTPRRDSSAARSPGYAPCEPGPRTVESQLSLCVLSQAGADRWILRGLSRAPRGFCRGVGRG